MDSNLAQKSGKVPNSSVRKSKTSVLMRKITGLKKFKSTSSNKKEKKIDRVDVKNNELPNTSSSQIRNITECGPILSASQTNLLEFGINKPDEIKSLIDEGQQDQTTNNISITNLQLNVAPSFSKLNTVLPKESKYVSNLKSPACNGDKLTDSQNLHKKESKVHGESNILIQTSRTQSSLANQLRINDRQSTTIPLNSYELGSEKGLSSNNEIRTIIKKSRDEFFDAFSQIKPLSKDFLLIVEKSNPKILFNKCYKKTQKATLLP